MRRRKRTVMQTSDGKASQYWNGDRVACQLPFAIEGIVFSTPEVCPIAGCYQVREDSGVEWYVLPEEIVRRIDEPVEVEV